MSSRASYMFVQHLSSSFMSASAGQGRGAYGHQLSQERAIMEVRMGGE